MLPADFEYDLPPELIAQQPLAERSASRLLHVRADSDAFSEYRFADLPGLLEPNDLLVLNNTRVLPGRLFGKKLSGGQIEMLLERVLESRLALVQLRANRAPAIGSRLIFEPDIEAEVEGREGRFYRLRFGKDIEPLLAAHGHVPLPPYIDRADIAADRERYQTVYARNPGAVAAPTAGLHFDEALLGQLAAKGIRTASLTLHVGAGTFLPLEDEQLEKGELHAEKIVVDQSVCAAVEQTRSQGGRIVAVGTTVVRALESAARDGMLAPFAGETQIFIRPGYRFQIVDAMITNFHLPQSSLLMLVSAFRGRETILAAYRHAVAERFRFFSYGDAMLLEHVA
jgi:S-adenosylmethionine:tRNA ribosyltransferase-isomerase